MSDGIKTEPRLSLGAIIALLAPLAALVVAYAFVNHLRAETISWLDMGDSYDRHRKFWGGNPSEVFSHWLDMVLMSGGAAVIGWLTSAEAFFRRSGNTLMRRASNVGIVLFLIGSGVTAVALDRMHGEGTVLLAYPIFFIPILASSYYLLRQIIALLRWRPAVVVAVSVGFVALQTVAQLNYEPSGTGGPNLGIIPVWLASVGMALVWAFVQSIRSGLLARFVQAARKPIIWGTTVLLILAIGIPVTLHARGVQKTHQDMTFAWLDELDTKLTDAFIAEIKRDHTPEKAVSDSRIPISATAHALLTDARVKGENVLRIYVPLNQDDFIFLWGNDRFEYCDIRQLARQIDQGFIDALIARGGTHQTRLYSVLWSPYMAGRVLKDKAGNVKAICVINAP